MAVDLGLCHPIVDKLSRLAPNCEGSDKNGEKRPEIGLETAENAPISEKND